jgi:subtilisin-like proprotein convertase family protein
MKRGVRRALVAATVGALVLAFAGIAGGKIKTKTFSSGDIDRTIPDPGTTSHTFNIRKKRSKVKDVNVNVRITHDDSEDLLISLSHAGRTVDLSSMNGETTGPEDEAYGTGAQSCDGTSTKFNDEAETEVEDANTPFGGQFVPEESLSTFDRTRLKGAWTLTVEDYDAAFDGELNCAELEIKYKKKKKRN